MSAYRIIGAAPHCRLGEGPLWSERQQCLFWVDILGQAIHQLRLGDGGVSRWDAPEMIGWLIEREAGPAFSADGRFLYHNDSGRGIVYRFELDPGGGIRDRRVWLQFAPYEGKPDGMTVDAEGGLWIAFWGAGCIRRYRADGQLDRAIGLPASQVTSCCFAGPQLDRPFVTSAADGVPEEPLAGALFEVEPGVRGLPTGRFGG